LTSSKATRTNIETVYIYTELRRKERALQLQLVWSLAVLKLNQSSVLKNLIQNQTDVLSDKLNQPKSNLVGLGFFGL
jgi:hypothetical protein